MLLPQSGQRQDFSIQGSVSFEEGSANEPIIVFLEALSSRPIEQTYTDPSGNFMFQDVAPGTYYIRIKAEGFEEFAQRLEVPVYNHDVAVFLRRKSQAPPASGDIHLGTRFQVDIRQLSIPKKAIRQYQKALHDNEEGNTSGAIRRLRDALSVAPNFIEAAFHLAATLYETGNLQEAEKTLTGALAIAPKEPHLRLMLANVLVKEAKYEEALAEIDRYLKERSVPVAVVIRPTLLELISVFGFPHCGVFKMLTTSARILKLFASPIWIRVCHIDVGAAVKYGVSN
jgi:tetratricopeptide (TPR) repeat protein